MDTAESKVSDLCYQAKCDWNRLAREGHENAYAASARYEALYTCFTIIADMAQEIENAQKEAIVVGWVCDSCSVDLCIDVPSSKFNFCPNCGKMVSKTSERGWCKNETKT